MAEKFYEIKNWKQYQHYGADRRMLWVKLYDSLWRDQKFFVLPERIKLRFIGLLTVASQSDNRKIPDNPAFISSIIGLSVRPSDLKALVNAGFLDELTDNPASKMLEDCPKQPANNSLDSYTSPSTSNSSSSLKKEKETQKEEATNQEAAAGSVPARKPETPIPDDFALTEERAYYAFKQGIADPPQEFSRFEANVKGKDLRRCDWDATWQEWIQSAVSHNRATYPPPRPSVATFPTDNPVELARRRCEAEQREQITPLLDRMRQTFKTSQEVRA